MEKNSLILLVQEDPAGAAEIRQALGQSFGAFRLQCVEGLSTALARIAGGGVDLVLLDLSLCNGHESGQPEAFLDLHGAAPHIPVVILCDAQKEHLALKAMRAGAADYIIKERWAATLASVAASAIKLRHIPIEINAGKPSAPASNRGRVIAFLGAKGGVGATTVALNMAAVLADTRRVILVEMRPAFGTLAQFFGVASAGRNLSRLLEREPAAITPAEVQHCLWPYKNIPGLSLLFAPPGAGHGEIEPAHATAILETLAGMADLVVADLPASLSDSNRASIEHSGLLVQIVERDPICVQLAKLMVRAIESWDASPRISPVIVNRATVVTPVPLPEIDSQIGIPALGVILPEADLCLRAQNARTPLVALQPDSMVAESLIALAEALAITALAAERHNMLLRA